MGLTQRFLSGFGRWRRRRDDRRASAAPDPTGPAPEPKTGTDRYLRRKEVDDEAVFGSASRESRQRHHSTGRFADPILAELIQDLWADFFACFREDERDFELAQFREQAAAIQTVLDQQGEDGIPDLVTCRQMLYLLARFVGQRFGHWDARLDQLLAEHRDQAAQINAIKLSTSWQSDELDYCRGIIASALKSRDSFIGENKDGTPLLVSELLCQLLAISKAPPRPQAFRRRGTTKEDATTGEPGAEGGKAVTAQEGKAEGPAEGEWAVVRRTLRDLLDGKATVAKLNRLLEDEELAQRLSGMTAQNRQYRTILSRIGLLPPE